MKESSVSSPFMSSLRAALPGAIVLKHHDASMIGLPDCQVMWVRKVAWFEFKLVVSPKRLEVDERYLRAIALESPAQFRMLCRLQENSHLAFYIYWIKKMNRIVVVDPLSGMILKEVKNNPELVEYVTACLRLL